MQVRFYLFALASGAGALILTFTIDWLWWWIESRGLALPFWVIWVPQWTVVFLLGFALSRWMGLSGLKFSLVATIPFAVSFALDLFSPSSLAFILEPDWDRRPPDGIPNLLPIVSIIFSVKLLILLTVHFLGGALGAWSRRGDPVVESK